MAGNGCAAGVDAQGSLYPMCGMNLAFSRELIGPAMYFGLMGDGQPLGRYDDMWAGWCSKARKPLQPHPLACLVRWGMDQAHCGGRHAMHASPVQARACW